MDAAALRSAWSTDGFVVVPGLFGAPEVAAVRAAFDRLERLAEALPPDRKTLHHGAQFVLGPTRPTGAPRLDRVVWCAAADDRLDAWGRDRRLTDLASILLGAARVVRPALPAG